MPVLQYPPNRVIQRPVICATLVFQFTLQVRTANGISFVYMDGLYLVKLIKLSVFQHLGKKSVNT